jgi:FkbM family methyltransferase
MFSRLLSRFFGPQQRIPPVAPEAPPVSAPVKAAGPVEGNVDQLIREHFFPDPAYRGVIVEVGAARPDFLAVSASFRNLGWRALAIEPNPHFAALHRAQGHEVIECACGEHDADDVPFYVVKIDGEYYGEQVTNESFSSLGVRGKYADLMTTMNSQVEEIRVPVRRLDTIFAERSVAPGAIDIISVDVEGWELEVLKGLDFSRFRPRVLAIENLFKEPSYGEFMAARGYSLWRHVEPNDVYVRA